MHNIYCFVGPSGSGKSAIVDSLSTEYGLVPVYSYTERPRRTAFETGHIFVSPEDFDMLEDLVAYTIYNGYRYGVPSQMVDDSDLYVIDPAGIEYLKHKYKGNKGIFVIGIDCPEELCKQRMLQRGDGEDNANSRLEYDKEAFKELYNICDVIIPNTGDLMAVVDKVYSVIISEEEENEQQ